MRGILEPDHLLLILAVALLLFGGKRIPEIAGSLGKGIRQFKSGMDGALTDDAPPAAQLPAPAARPDDEARAPKRLLVP